MAWVSIRETAAALGVSPDTVRRRIRAGQLEARKAGGRWQVKVPAAAAAPPPEPVREPDAAPLARQAADLQAENRMLRGQLATMHATLDHEREQAGLVARTLEQFSRALPAPAADAAPARAPWWRRAFVRTGGR